MLTWSSRNGRGKRAHRTPGRISIASPGFGAVAWGNSIVSGSARLNIVRFLTLLRSTSPASLEREEARRAGGVQLAAWAERKDAASRIVRMSRSLCEAQHRGEAGVAAFEQRAPMGARTAQEERAEALF